MKNGIKFVSIFMVVMVLIGLMMAPANAENYTPKYSFEDRFETVLELYLEREGYEGQLVIEEITKLGTGDYLVILDVDLEQFKDEFTDPAFNPDEANIRMYLIVSESGAWTSTLIGECEGMDPDVDTDCGDDIWYDLFDM